MKNTRIPVLLMAVAMSGAACQRIDNDPDAADAGGSPTAAGSRTALITPVKEPADVDGIPTAAAPPGLVTPWMIAEALELPCPEVSIPRETPVSEVLASISRHMSEQSGVPIIFVVDHIELEMEGVSSLSDVTVGELHLPSGSHTCREVIRLLLDQTFEPQLAIIPRLRHILVTSLAGSELPDHFEVRAYDVGALLKAGRAGDDSGPRGETTTVDSPEARVRPTADSARSSGARFASSRKLRQTLLKHTAATVVWMTELDEEG